MCTDDWPYLYLKNKQIPAIFALAGLLLIVLFFLRVGRLKRIVSRAGAWRTDIHFFALGAAFMLLELFGINKASLILGNTWVVNAIVVSSILLMIVLANGFVLIRTKSSLILPGLALLATSAAVGLTDFSSFMAHSLPARAAIFGTVVALPVLFSGMVFATSFASTDDKSRSLGINLFGSLCGALMQSLTFVYGNQTLILITFVFYAIAVAVKLPFERGPEPVASGNAGSAPASQRKPSADPKQPVS